MAVVFVEVRGLKQFVTRYSFARGDRLLDFVGDLLLKLAGDRPGDLAARLGADEFLVVTTPEAVEGLPTGWWPPTPPSGRASTTRPTPGGAGSR